MPLIKLEKPGFIYLVYQRTGDNDFAEFKAMLTDLLVGDLKKRDIVVDLTKLMTLATEETVMLAKTVEAFTGTTRLLKLIANGPVLKKLESLTLHKKQRLVVFNDHAQFLADCNAHPPVPPA